MFGVVAVFVVSLLPKGWKYTIFYNQSCEAHSHPQGR